MYKILVIDDEVNMVTIIKEILGLHGHNVETAANGKEGIAKFKKGCFDLVITDICMPEVSGNGVAQYIKGSDRKHIPVIGISGTAWRVEEKMFDTVIEKPFLLKTLISSVQKLLIPCHSPATATATATA
jgi:two-component system response regulator VanR